MLELNTPPCPRVSISATAVKFSSRGRLPPTCADKAARGVERERGEERHPVVCREKAAAKILKIFVHSHSKSSKANEHCLAHALRKY